MVVGQEGEVIMQQAPVSVGREAVVTKAGDYRAFFGWRSDPFFFDANGNFNCMKFTEDDFFKDKNVCSIVIELPNAVFGNGKVGIWARTVDKTEEDWIQADRCGRPMQAVFLLGEEREAYLSGEPANDDRFIGVFAHELEHTGGYKPEDATAVARKFSRCSFLSSARTGALSAQWQDTDRRCCRCFPICAHERKGNRR